MFVARYFGKNVTASLYLNPDVNDDGTVDIFDIILVAQHFGEVYSPAAPSKNIWKVDRGHRSAGIYINKEKSAYWDGKNTGGEKTASGIYFYSIQAGDFTATKKMAIVE